MSGPPTKKQKVAAIEPPPLDPIIFKAAGMKCDARLLVFHQEFQVHSMILKLHSAFFRKFMDSPEKKDQTPQDGFQYNWTTSLDEEGAEWHLVSTKNYANHEPYEMFKGSIDNQQARINELLCTFYMMPYAVHNIDQLSQLTELADYYCSLRALSASLGGAIIANKNAQLWYDTMQLNVETSLKIAMKLRNSMMFKDALIFAVSPWSHRGHIKLGTPKLKKIAQHAYKRIAMLIAEAYRTILEHKSYIDHLDEATEEATDGTGDLQAPLYFRAICDDKECISSGLDLHELEKVLECNLAFQTEGFRAGLGEHADHFFCATIPDDELPWDINDEDY